jgi:2,3,4,5-tetrahydropyridine-2-carboxylate N-succinyltransferase
MDRAALERAIDDAFEQRSRIGVDTGGPVRTAVEAALDGLDAGRFRVAEKMDGVWRVHEWLKKAVLLSFRLNPLSVVEGGPDGAHWWDKIPSKFISWGTPEFTAAGFRAVPGCVVRHSAYIAPDVVLMPCFVNLGAHVDRGTMIDTWATVGSMCTSRAGPGSAACSSRCRRRQSSSRTTVSSAPAPRSPRV